MDDMDERIMDSMLLDLYGSLLTDKQREALDMHLNEDITISELADESYTSRQAVSDLIKRTKKLLRSYEEKMGLLKKRMVLEERIEAVIVIVKELPGSGDAVACLEEAKEAL
ncbi:MAG: DNA-binding protein [Eubacteriaceae bacterium]|nr:DNA-binding protein [Eubacteriaceae bacterium]